MTPEMILEQLVERYPVLRAVQDEVWNAYEMLKECYLADHKLLIAGNGGSAADAEHIVGELMKGFVKPRKIGDEQRKAFVSVDEKMGEVLSERLQGALPAIALVDHVALSTAYLNDVDPLLGFAQQLQGYGKRGDVFWGISTSGNSQNILYASVVAKAKGLKVIGLTGKDGGRLKELCDVCIVVPEQETYKIQELHLPIYHALCLMLEECFF